MEAWNTDFWDKNSSSCLAELKKPEIWEKLPLMNETHSHQLREGQLVRFRGMVQDMYNPVYYLASYEVLNTQTNERTVRSGKYRDSLHCAENEKVLFDSEASVNQERRPVYCISVPAVNSWAQLKKGEVTQTNVEGSSGQSSTGVKRSVEDTVEETNQRTTSSEDVSKRVCVARPSETTNADLSNDLNLPIPDNKAEACLVNFYDFVEGSLKMNDMIEAVGFLSYDLATVTSAMDGSVEQLPPPSQVPRLHAVASRPVHSCNPLITPQVTIDEVMQNASRLRGELKLVLTQLLLGDSLAAEYLICHLISRVYLRQDVLVLGKFSLNLSNMPTSLPEYTSQLYHFLEHLLDKSHYLAMTIDTMNTTTMIPKKNYDTNRLESGLLQLSDKTHLVLDETKLQPGQLNDKGVRNCRALASVITNQRLQYDFQFYPIEFETDIPVLILSEGKSMLPNDCHLALQADPVCLTSISEAFTAAQHYLKEPLLSQLRVYLSFVSTADYDLSPEVQQLVQEDFVQMRQDQPKTSAQDLHSLLVLAKLLSLSQGSQCLTQECWQTARQMEAQRKERLLNPSQ